MSRYRLDRQRGHTRRVPAGPAAARVRSLVAAGWSFGQIATAAHCAERTISALHRGEHPTVDKGIAERIAVAAPTIHDAHEATRVDSTGTVRRLRALVAIGHTQASIADALGVYRSVITHITAGDHAQVTVATARNIANLYTQWRWRPGTSVRARNHAAKRGWASPLAWDDIDNPAETPEATPLPELVTQAKRAAVRNTEIRHLASFGESEEQIAIRLGLDVKDVRGRLAKWRREGALTQNDTEQAA
jgi:transcriptional regulator with XRE-family HTH domain